MIRYINKNSKLIEVLRNIIFYLIYSLWFVKKFKILKFICNANDKPIYLEIKIPSKF